eukprot:jgi/Undpi1/7128/HiC_scaffold_22.g09602.m1
MFLGTAYVEDLEEMFPKNPNVVADMTALHHIHEPGILHNLKERSRPWRQTPYTFMGTILLAVNPLKAVPTPLVEDFKDQSLDPEIPHPYAIAELSYNQMRMAGGRAGTNQSIVVSGESGAGKTETVKIILGYLARRTAGTDENLEERVLESSPILESFGNAKTLRNDNSSRFGKFLKLRFTSGESSYLDGASVEPYLLEKSRVLAQGEGERNFHILYEMIAGATQCGLAEELKLESASDYRILSSSGCITLEGIDDADRFKAIQDAFSVVGVEKDAQMQVWQALSGVLHLSTLSFHETDHQEGPVAAISDKAALSTTASLLGVSEQALEDMLTVKVVPVTRGEVFTKRLAVKEAVRARDAAIKSLYEALFLWVVRAINLSLGGAKVAGDDKLPFIGLLDIFGFENFGTKNNLEQLLINYANESLQGDFNKQVFENELRVYAEEGIDVTVSAAVYTSSCLRMLTGKRDGVLPVLDDVCSQPLPTDKRYLERLHVAFTRRRGEGMDVTVKSGGRDAHESFWVNHYASKVLYTVEGWVERNMDSVPQSFSDTMLSSQHATLLTRRTVAGNFMASMQDLSTTLAATTCGFVRCIKPNAAMDFGIFDSHYVVEQLRCLGVLRTCEVLKVGMPTRVSYADLKKSLGDGIMEAERMFEGQPEKSLVAAILWAFDVPSEAFRLGAKRVFFRSGQIAVLHKILNETPPDKLPWVLSRLRLALANRRLATVAAEEAEDSLAEAEAAVMEAEAVSSNTVRPINSQNRVQSPLSPGASADEDMRALVATVDKARRAAQNAVQVKTVLKAAAAEGVGENAIGASDKIQEAADAALADIAKAAERANELERLTNVGVTGADGSAGETSAARELHAALRDVRDGLINAQKLWRGAEEAADKCQVGFAVVGRGGAAVVFCSVGCLVLFWGMVAFVRCFLLVLCCFRRMLGVGLGLCRWFVGGIRGGVGRFPRAEGLDRLRSGGVALAGIPPYPGSGGSASSSTRSLSRSSPPAGGDKQGKPPRRAPTWTQYYFRLKSEEMKLSSSTVTSYTNTKNCFCVRTNNVSWFLLARSLEDMKRWMSAINKETRLIFQREHGVHDDYMGQGRRGRFFYRMVEGSTPQWILTHPMAKAPRAGDGLFPGEVIEVTQVLSSGSLTFLRLANNRGWTYARSPTNGDVLFEDLAGGVSEDTEEYSFPSGAKGIVPILHGPGLRTQATGVTIRPGERVRAAERFTPVDNTRVVFVKLEDERGWIPVKTDVRGPATVLQGW